MSHIQSNESTNFNSTSPTSRRGSNPFSLRIGEILELRQQIAEQQRLLSEKLEQDWQRFESRVIAPAFDHDAILDHPDIVSGHDYVPNGRIDFNDPDFKIEDWCEPDCPFDSDGNYIDSDSKSATDDDTDSDSNDEADDMSIDSSSESETKHETDNDSDSEDRFIVDLSIYQKVSYKHFDFHHWLKEFDLICIKEILVYHNLQTKDMWTRDNFDAVLAHALVKRDNRLKSQIDTMLKIFISLKRQHFTGKGVWESDDDDNNDNNNRNGTDIIYRRPSNNDEPQTWDQALLRQHFENPEADYVPFKGINFKIHKMPPMPEMPPMPSMPMDFRMHQMPPMPEMPSMPSNLQYHFR